LNENCSGDFHRRSVRLLPVSQGREQSQRGYQEKQQEENLPVSGAPFPLLMQRADFFCLLGHLIEMCHHCSNHRLGLDAPGWAQKSHSARTLQYPDPAHCIHPDVHLNKALVLPMSG
jgi:hypothetical protein